MVYQQSIEQCSAIDLDVYVTSKEYSKYLNGHVTTAVLSPWFSKSVVKQMKIISQRDAELAEYRPVVCWISWLSSSERHSGNTPVVA